MLMLNRSLVSCTNSRASDIASAARVFREAAERGEPAKVHPNVEFYLAAASTNEQKFAEESGDWQILQDAGAKVLPSGCESQCNPSCRSFS
jgi:homoaconitate hydratase